MSSFPPQIIVPPRILMRGARRILGIPLEFEAASATIEHTPTEVEWTSPELTYPDINFFYKISAENPNLTFDEAYNQFVVGGGRPPSPPHSSNGSGSDSSDSKPEEESKNDMAENRAGDPPTTQN